MTGPVFGFSDTWQLVINTATTIVTFLMVFVIQNSQNRDAKAVHAKLDELIRSIATARNEFVNAETEPEAMLDRQIDELRALAVQHPHLADAERLVGCRRSSPPRPMRRLRRSRGTRRAGSWPPCATGSTR